MEAARKQSQGMELEALAQWLEEHKLNLCHWFTVDTFEHLKHGGRVSAASATVGSLLGIKPLLHVDDNGKLVAIAKPRGQKKALQMLRGSMEKGWMPQLSNQVIIGHGDALHVAQELKTMVAAQFPEAQIHIADIGPIIGAHAGPGVLAFLFWGSNH